MRGKLVILLIITLAMLATGGAWWYRRQAGRRALEFWGPEAAQRIRHARNIQLLRLASQPLADSGAVDAALPMGISEPSLAIDGVPWWIHDWQDISRAPGVTHARHSLIEDASFVWDRARGTCRPSWSYAWRFADASGQTVVLLDLDCDRIRTLQGTRDVGLKFGDGLRTFCGEQFQRR